MPFSHHKHNQLIIVNVDDPTYGMEAAVSCFQGCLFVELSVQKMRVIARLFKSHWSSITDHQPPLPIFETIMVVQFLMEIAFTVCEYAI